MSKVIWRFPSDAATLTVSSEDADYPAEYAQSSTLQPPWRTDADSSQTWQANLGAIYTIGAMAVLGHTIPDGDGITAQGNDADWPDPSDFTQAGVSDDEADLLMYFSAAQAYQWWRMTTALAASSPSTIDVGRILFGPVYDLGRSPAPGSLQWGAIDTGKTYTTLGGQIHADVGVTLRTMQCKLSGVTQTVSDELDALVAQMGNHTPFIFHPDPTGRPDEWIYGILRSHKSRKDAAFGANWNWEFDMVEAK